jgi:hypothetical protein
VRTGRAQQVRHQLGEGYGAQPGTVEMIDLRNFTRVASVDVGQMAGGIAFWRSMPPRR